MTSVCIIPTPDSIRDDNGVGQVVHAQYKYLPAHGIELTGPESADVIACHITQAGAPRVDVLHTHGLYFDDIAHAPYLAWHHEANRLIIDAARKAYAVTVPSRWVAEPFKRDMRISPQVIGHGIELDAWQPAGAVERPFYALWNKNRASDVCDPTPAVTLASWGVDVITTFAPIGATNLPPNLRVIGSQPHATMRELVRHAGVYLATTRETFGIGTLEALAAGVPVLGYDYGGTADLVEHKVSGYLVKPGDTEGLLAGLDWLKAHPEVGANARARAEQYRWKAVAQRYADLYHAVAEQRRTERHGVSVVITNYNYADYVKGAIDSVKAQTQAVEEIIVVDDGSTDNSTEVLAGIDGITVLSQRNQGVAAARNTGIAHASGAYVVCLDADDQLHHEYCRVLSQALDADRGLGVAYSGLGILQENGTVNPNPWPPEFDWKAQATPANPPSNCIPCAAMFRRSMWERAGGYKQVHAPAEDTEFFTRGLAAGFTARRVTQEPLFQYRMHPGSASRTKEYRPIDTWHPWMRDGLYPMAAPCVDRVVPVRSYADPLISVIIPVGPGHSKYLPTALESLLGQTLRQWEVIVVNDGADAIDLTPYPFVKLVLGGIGRGPGAARNAGIQAARAPLMLFLDADDYLAPDALEKFIRLYIDSGGQYIYSDWFALRNGQMEAHQVDDYTQAGWLERGMHAVTALIPSEHVRGVGGFDARMRGWEDWDFFIKLAISGVCGQRLPEPLLIYRQHTGTIREQSLANKDELLAALRDRYAAYATGEKPMSSCCGGNADTILAAKAAIERANGPAGAESAWLPPQNTAAEGPPVARLKFTGPQRGAITYVGRPSGRQYRAGNNPLEQYIDVDPRDVAHLVGFGCFEVVRQPVAPVIPPQAEVVPVLSRAEGPPPPPPADGGERPMLDLAGDLPADLEAVVNQQAQRVRRGIRQQ